MIIIGSRAMSFKMGLENRIDVDKTDFDVIMSVEEFMKWQEKNEMNIISLIPRSAHKYKAVVQNKNGKIQYEIELAFPGTSNEFLINNEVFVTSGEIKGWLGERFNILKLRYQMLTKRSHLIYPIHFEKNINDYHKMLEFFGGSISMDEDHQTYYDLRYKETAERMKQRTPKLNVTTEDFFSSTLAVPNYFVHDHIHEMMAHDSVPMYSKMQPDPSKAWCSKDMFFNMTYDEQIKCVQEEAYVIALERYIIPQHGDIYTDHFECYKRAAMRICTTLCSGWFRDFAIENYSKVIQQYDKNFVAKFISKVLSGEIKPQDPHTYIDVPLLRKKVIDLI